MHHIYPVLLLFPKAFAIGSLVRGLVLRTHHNHHPLEITEGQSLLCPFSFHAPQTFIIQVLLATLQTESSEDSCPPLSLPSPGMRTSTTVCSSLRCKPTNRPLRLLLRELFHHSPFTNHHSFTIWWKWWQFQRNPYNLQPSPTTPTSDQASYSDSDLQLILSHMPSNYFVR